MASPSDIRAGGAYVELGARNDSLLKGLFDSAKAVERYASTIQGINLRLAGTGAAMISPLVVGAQKFAGHAESIEKNSQVSGMGTAGYQEMAYAAGETGVEKDALTT